MDKDIFFLPLHLKLKSKICIRKSFFSPLDSGWSEKSVCVYPSACVCQKSSSVFCQVEVWWGLVVPCPLLKIFHSLSVSGKGGGGILQQQQQKSPTQRKTKRERMGEESCPPADSQPPSTSASSLLVVVVFLLLAVGQRGAGADLAVAVQPLLHHLSDERVVAAAGAFLKRNQNAALCHAAVQPLPQELLLLLFITHLKDRRGQT